MDLGLRRNFTWRFVIADVQCPIIGKDLLSHYGLLVDCKHNRLLDGTTLLNIPGHTASYSVPSVKIIAAGATLDNLLQEFPELTTPSEIPRRVLHTTMHHI